MREYLDRHIVPLAFPVAPHLYGPQHWGAVWKGAALLAPHLRGRLLLVLRGILPRCDQASDANWEVYLCTVSLTVLYG